MSVVHVKGVRGYKPVRAKDIRVGQALAIGATVVRVEKYLSLTPSMMPDEVLLQIKAPERWMRLRYTDVLWVKEI